MDLMQLCFVIKTRVAWWIKAKFPSLKLSWDDFIANISTVQDQFYISTRPSKHVSWTPPPSRWLKFNVGGSMKADGSKGGIGGVLKDEHKSTLLTFLLKIGSNKILL
ncbi:hypothetical protein V6N12_024374 [Hibiscus sabdariffa]|uniref:Uncharacterized protein n=1 Tax=Hibiscus sabdariffa TaxID=183260 RepID=A0ABR2G0W0_9ROSI